MRVTSTRANPSCSRFPHIRSVRIAMWLQAKRSQFASRCALCMLMCVIVWDGPIPILHHHGSGHAEDWLTRHCQAWHTSSSDSGFHWHFARLKDLDGRSSSNGDQESSQNREGVLIALMGSQCQIAAHWQVRSWPIITPDFAAQRRNSRMWKEISSVTCSRSCSDFSDPHSICTRFNIWLV